MALTKRSACVVLIAMVFVIYMLCERASFLKMRKEMTKPGKAVHEVQDINRNSIKSTHIYSNDSRDDHHFRKRFQDAMMDPNLTVTDFLSFDEIRATFLDMIFNIKYNCSDDRRMGVPIPRDGGYNVCLDVGIKPGNCTVYSVGIASKWSFDDAMAEYGCNVYCFDPFNGLQTHRRSERVMFYAIGMCGYDDDKRKFPGDDRLVECKTLETIRKMLHHEKDVIDVVKFDIEGGEYECLPQIIHSDILASVKQLSFEIHMNSQSKRKTFDDTCHLLRELERRHGFKLWSARENTVVRTNDYGKYGGVHHNNFEISYLNTNFLGKRKS
ncbi:probable methyltransferase-like protein 24 isoform X2 [Ptychodera flava]|uniref:probable methyltransferase-like protein 24 isoform X2 n=1 Tax=Ptychodera flava TaxID=63121 RepID=UPI00396A7280